MCTHSRSGFLLPELPVLPAISSLSCQNVAEFVTLKVACLCNGLVLQALVLLEPLLSLVTFQQLLMHSKLHTHCLYTQQRLLLHGPFAITT